MTHEAKWARIDGQIAAIRGAGARTNPHVIGSDLSRAWAQGWREVSNSERICECGAVLRSANKTGRCHRCAVRSANCTRILPDDFTQVAPGKTNAQLMEHYNCCADVVTRFRKEAGIPANHGGREAPILPADFYLVAPTLMLKELRQRYGRGQATINRWLSEAGVQHARYVPTPPPKPLRVHVPPPANLAHATQAAAFLGKLGPISRCDENGCFNPDGHYWRRGSSVLCAAEVIARATRQGFEPDAWRKVQAA